MPARSASRWCREFGFPQSLEPISKSLEEDCEARELHEAKEVLRVELATDQNTALNPSEEPLDQPTPRIASKSPSVLRRTLAAIGPVRRDQCDHRQVGPQRGPRFDKVYGKNGH